MKNKLSWLPLALEEAKEAKYLNNPSSSRKIEIKVIEKNKTNIFKGLIVEPVVSCLPTSSSGDKPKERRNIAPTNATIQYVSITMFLILI